MEVDFIDMYNSCRACLTPLTEDDSDSIFNNYYENNELYKILMIIAPVTINEDDGFSPKICEECKSNAINAYIFRQTCILSEETLIRASNEAKDNSLSNQVVEEELDEEEFLNNEVECPEVEEEIKQENDENIEHEMDEVNIDQDIDDVNIELEIDEVNIEHGIDEVNIEEYVETLDFEDETMTTEESQLCEVAEEYEQYVVYSDSEDVLNNVQIVNCESGEKVMSCPFCLKCFVNSSNLAKHVIEQHGSRKIQKTMKKASRVYQCQHCDKVCVSPSKLERHMNVHAKGKFKGVPANNARKADQKPRKFPCSVCNKFFESPSKVQRHMSVHRAPNELPSDTKTILQDGKETLVSYPRALNYKHECKICGKKVESPSKLMRHMNVHDPNRQIGHGVNKFRPYGCDNCPLRFWDEYAMERHMIIHSEAVIESKIKHPDDHHYVCVICLATSKQYDDLFTHMRSHKDEIDITEAIVCQMCNKSFGSLQNIIRHSRTHDENATHQCIKCGKTFGMGEDFIDHMLRHENYKPFSCDQCDKSFLKLHKLRSHMAVHEETELEKPFLCTLCGKAFAEQDYLKRHMLRHTGVKSFSCNQCPSRFTFKSGLTSHMLTHTGLKPFTCDICGTSFAKSQALTKHHRTHTGERPYVCAVCGMRFIASGHLSRHNRVHTGEKPYKCQYCERAYAQSNDLVKHLRTHVGMNTYSCKYCPFTFRLHGELKAHYAEHYKNGTEMIEDLPDDGELLEDDEDPKEEV